MTSNPVIWLDNRSRREFRFYIRTGNETQPLGIKESIEYIQEHWTG